MFPTTDNSLTIIETLTAAAEAAEVEIRTSEGVDEITPKGNHYVIQSDLGNTYTASNVLLATGGTRLAAGAKLATALGHNLIPPVPSLFTFKITDSRISQLSGLSVAHTEIKIPGSKLSSSGPTLITHWGMSGPGILKISAWGARELAEKDYNFQICVNWIPNDDPIEVINDQRNQAGKRQVSTYSPFPDIPKRLWQSFLKASSIPEKTLWSQLNKEHIKKLTYQTMQSKLHPGLYFAGEIMDVDGITGGFNFQNAWTTGFHAGMDIAYNLADDFE